MLGKIPLLFLFVVSTSFAADIILENDGLGYEALMGGVGVAKIGSNGSLLSNPSLLAWLPKKHEFMSTNQILYYRFKDDTKVSPQVIPRYAVSSEGFDTWGHAYGFTSSTQKVSLTAESNVGPTKVKGMTDSLSLNYGLGKKISNLLSIGGALRFARYSQETSFTASGFNGSDNFLISADMTENIWILSGTVGGAYIYKTWAFGISGRTGLGKFGQTAETDQSYFSTSTGTTVNDVYHTKSRMPVVGSAQAGLQKKFETTRFYFDFTHVFDYQNEEGNQNYGSDSYNAGLETPFWDPRFRLYTGLLYSASERVSNEANKESAGVYVGGSKKNTHSTNYLGFGYNKDLRESQHLFVITFGTRFDY